MIEPNDLKRIEEILTRCELVDEEETKLLEKIKLLNEEIKIHEEYIEKSREIKNKVFELDKKDEVKNDKEENTD